MMNNQLIPRMIICKKDLLSLVGLCIQLEHLNWFQNRPNNSVKIVYTPFERFTRGHNSYVKEVGFSRLDLIARKFASRVDKGQQIDVCFTGYLALSDTMVAAKNVELALGSRARLYRYDDTHCDYLDLLTSYNPSKLVDGNNSLFLTTIKRLANDPCFMRGVLPQNHYDYNVFCGALCETMSVFSVNKLLHLEYKKDIDSLAETGKAARRFVLNTLQKENI